MISLCNALAANVRARKIKREDEFDKLRLSWHRQPDLESA